MDRFKPLDDEELARRREYTAELKRQIGPSTVATVTRCGYCGWDCAVAIVTSTGRSEYTHCTRCDWRMQALLVPYHERFDVQIANLRAERDRAIERAERAEAALG